MSWMPGPDVTTANDFFLAGNEARIAPLVPMVITTRQQAYRTAAWLEVMAMVLPPEPGDHSYDAVRTAIANT